MPFNGFTCEVTAEPVSAPACLACARKGGKSLSDLPKHLAPPNAALTGCPMTAPVIQGITENLRPDHFGVTVTTLLGCARKHRLKQTTEYWLKPSELWWAYRGQLMHGVAAAFVQNDASAIAEHRFSMMVDAPDGSLITITGQPDLVLVDRRHILDYKTTKRLPQPWKIYTCPETGQVIREGPYTVRTKQIECAHCFLERHPTRDCETTTPPRPYRTHVHQVSLYRLLLEENGIPVETGEIVYQDMAGQLRLPVELLPRPAAWKMLQARLGLFVEEGLPPKLTDPEEIWECEYCPVVTACEQLHRTAQGRSNGKTPEEILLDLGY